MTFIGWENICMETLTFKIANFLDTIHTILGRPRYTKFMAIPNYTYLKLKIPAPKGSSLWVVTFVLCICANGKTPTLWRRVSDSWAFKNPWGAPKRTLQAKPTVTSLHSREAHRGHAEWWDPHVCGRRNWQALKSLWHRAPFNSPCLMLRDVI